MADNHNQSFFGQSTGLTIQSASKSEPYIFLRCIKKKEDDTWEKPSKGEGKTIKCSLDEMVMMLQVLKREIQSWSSYHSYKDKKTQISFNWEENDNDRLWINIGDYKKMLGFAQAEIFRMLLKHILKEKINNATVSSLTNLKNSGGNGAENPQIGKNSEKNRKLNTEKSEINGSIKTETEKALLVVFDSGKEVWIPKSTVRSQYASDLGVNQSFVIDNWILERNQVKA